MREINQLQAEIKRLQANLADVIEAKTYAESSRDNLQAKVERLQTQLQRGVAFARERVELRTEVKRLRQHVSDCQSGMYINCVYCGHRYGPKGAHAETVVDGLPMAEALRRHIELCPEHPMSKLQTEIEQLRTDHDKLVDWISVNVPIRDYCRKSPDVYEILNRVLDERRDVAKRSPQPEGPGRRE